MRTPEGTCFLTLLIAQLSVLSAVTAYDCVESCWWPGPVVFLPLDGRGRGLECLLHVPDNPAPYSPRPCQITLRPNCTEGHLCRLRVDVINFAQTDAETCVGGVGGVAMGGQLAKEGGVNEGERTEDNNTVSGSEVISLDKSEHACPTDNSCEYIQIDELQNRNSGGHPYTVASHVFQGRHINRSVVSATSRKSRTTSELRISLCYSAHRFTSRSAYITFSIIDVTPQKGVNMGPRAVWALGTLVVIFVSLIILIARCPAIDRLLNPPPATSPLLPVIKT